MKTNILLICLAIGLVFCFAGCDGSGGNNFEITSSTAWLNFKANTENVKISTIVDSDGTPSSPDPSLEYSVDGGKTWKNFKIGDTSVTLKNVGDKMYIRAVDKNIAFSDDDEDLNFRFITFTMTGSVAAGGNVMSLVDKDCKSKEIPSRVCFSSLFENCTGLISAPILPATTLKKGCYSGMFYNCPSLTKAPVLPATELAENCYGQMFIGCTSLTVAPELKSTVLKNNCYEGMFINSGITAAPELPAVTMTERCYSGMFNGCTALSAAPVLPATALAKSCYYRMFMGCTNLTAAPDLPATDWVKECYKEMFRDCTKLNRITVHITEWPDWLEETTEDWVKNVSDSGDFYCPAGLDTSSPSDRRNPSGWTVHDLP